MEILEAVTRSIRAYYEDNDQFKNTKKLKEMKYTKDYFDNFESSLLGEEEAKKAPKEAKVDPQKQAALSDMMAAQKDQDSMKKENPDEAV